MLIKSTCACTHVNFLPMIGSIWKDSLNSNIIEVLSNHHDDHWSFDSGMRQGRSSRKVHIVNYHIILNGLSNITNDYIHSQRLNVFDGCIMSKGEMSIIFELIDPIQLGLLVQNVQNIQNKYVKFIESLDLNNELKNDS